MRYHRGTDLIALACTDGCVRVIDIATHKLIRELWPSRPVVPELSNIAISDYVFSSDGHWIAAAMGDLVLLWDLPTGHLVDAFKLTSPCTSLAFSPTGEYLATSTSDSVGVDIWTNKTLFTHVPTRHIGATELKAVLSSNAQAPTASGEGGQNLIAAEVAEESDDDEDAIAALPDIDTLSSDLLSLSLVPRSRWQNLLHIDLIRQRNKPTEAPKKPEKAPFFLPSLQDQKSGITTTAQKAAEETNLAQIEQERSRVLKNSRAGTRSQFTTLLQAADVGPTSDYSSFVEHLKTLNPAAADIEIRSLSVVNDELSSFVQSLAWLMEQRQDFELGQAWMAVFLRCHGDVVANDDSLRAAVSEWQQGLMREKERVVKLSGYAGGMVGWLRAARV
jgi:U3 small nucleolar RNA-associated protein 21